MPLDLREPKAKFLKRWHELSAFTGIAYHIGRSDRSVLFELPPLEFAAEVRLPTGFDREQMLKLKGDFAFWTVAQMLRDLTEAFEHALAPPFVYSLRRKAASGDLAKDKVLKLCKTFERGGLAEKSAYVQEHLGIGIPKVEQIDSLHRIRHCLAQRSGIVARRDCDEGCDYVELRWTKLVAYVFYPDGRQEQARPGAAPPPGGELGVRAEEGRLRVDIGHRVTLSGALLSEVLTTYAIAVGEFYNLCKAQLGDEVLL
jgi:hypothetical protein